MEQEQKFGGVGTLMTFAKRHAGLSPDRFAFRYKEPFFLVDFHNKQSDKKLRFKTTVFDYTLRNNDFGDSFREATNESLVFPVRKSTDNFPGMVTIGRAPNTDLRIDSLTLSKLHACLRQDEKGNWFIQDLGSKNGTVVNKEILMEGSRALLTDGDSIFFGPGVQAFFFHPMGLCEYISIFMKYHGE